MKNAEKTIPIVFICDEKYVLPTIVAITSLAENKKLETFYDVFVLINRLSGDSQELFRSIEKKMVKIHMIPVEISHILEELTIPNLHVTTTALCKFYIGNLFPQYDKIIYLDGDVIVQKDLSDLFDLDISGKYAAVVKDFKAMTYTPSQTKRLGIEHSAYFNSGVMLLNLKKIREDEVFEKLVDYRVNGKNYFMDQDAFNVVFAEKVIYTSLFFNVMSSVIGKFETEKIKAYYEIDKEYSEYEIYERAYIIHLCTSLKPWEFVNVPFADEWDSYYQKSPYTQELYREYLDANTQKKFFSKMVAENSKQALGIHLEVIVSLTSYPPRINYVPKVIESLNNQTIKPDRILLWLSKEEFPNQNDLPQALKTQEENNIVQICWCEDIKPHKKYYYAMQQYPDSILITVDDDIYYDSDMVKDLLISYSMFPYAVSCNRAHLMTIKNGKIAPYSEWEKECKCVGIPSLALCPTGCAGVLYPPHILPRQAFDIENITKTSLYADDLWLKVMEIISRTPAVLARDSNRIDYIDGSQDIALWKSNVIEHKNDGQLQNILSVYGRIQGDDSLIERVQLSAMSCKKTLNKRGNTVGRNKIIGAIQCVRDHGFWYTVKYGMSRIKRKLLK